MALEAKWRMLWRDEDNLNFDRLDEDTLAIEHETRSGHPLGGTDTVSVHIDKAEARLLRDWLNEWVDD